MIKRIEILIYFNYKQALVQMFRDLGADVEYVNKRAGYAVTYISEDKVKNYTETLKHTHGIKKYEFSPTELVEINI